MGNLLRGGETGRRASDLFNGLITLGLDGNEEQKRLENDAYQNRIMSALPKMVFPEIIVEPFDEGPISIIPTREPPSISGDIYSFIQSQGAETGENTIMTIAGGMVK